jgi:CelD/BcsL family acetyltransferase involved in cellulose biosynthesis
VGELDVRIMPASERAEAQAIWAQLESSSQDGGVLCSWAWTGTWLEHFGERIEHRFVVAEREGRPRGIALLTRFTLPGPARHRRLQLGTVGAPGVYVEYNRLLAERADRAAFATALLRTVRGQRGWDEFGLDGLDEDEAAAFLAAEPRLEAKRLPTRVADLQALAGPGGRVVGGTPARTRRRLEQTERELGPVSLDVVDDPAHAPLVFAELARLHQARWGTANGGGLLLDEASRAFHLDAMRRLMPERALLFRLRSGPQTIGCVYGLVENRRLLFYVSGVRTPDDPRLAPGLLTHALSMQACLDRGLGEYDFLAGGERYKRELTNSERMLLWATIRRRRPRAFARRAIVRARALAARG